MKNITVGSKWKWIGPSNYWSDTLSDLFEKGDEFIVQLVGQDHYNGIETVTVYRAEWPADQVGMGGLLASIIYTTDFVKFFELVAEPTATSKREHILGNCRCSSHMLLWGGHERSCPYSR